MAQSVECMPHKHMDLSSDPQNLGKKQGITVCAYTPCLCREVESGGSLKLTGQLAQPSKLQVQ